jgi:hypothetical protein
VCEKRGPCAHPPKTVPRSKDHTLWVIGTQRRKKQAGYRNPIGAAQYCVGCGVCVWGVRVGCACGLLCDDWGSAAYLVALAVPSDLGHALSEYIVCISTGIQGPGAQASRQARKPKAPHQIQMRDGPSRRALVAMPVAIVVSMSMTMVPRVLQALT